MLNIVYSAVVRTTISFFLTQLLAAIYKKTRKFLKEIKKRIKKKRS